MNAPESPRTPPSCGGGGGRAAGGGVGGRDGEADGGGRVAAQAYLASYECKGVEAPVENFNALVLAYECKNERAAAGVGNDAATTTVRGVVQRCFSAARP